MGCADCKSFYAETFPTLEEAENFYKSDYRRLESATSAEYPTDAHKRTHVIRAARQLALVLNVLSGADTALDFGCALGWTVQVMKFLGMDAYGVEMGADDRVWAKENLGLTLYEKLEDVPIDKFDIITMSHVLEHFIDPIGHMKTLYEHMNQGGRMIIEVPNWETPSAWSAFHAVVFNTQSLANTAQEAGFQVEVLRSHETDALYPANLIWMVARKPHEDDANQYTEVRNPSRTIQPDADPDLSLSLQKSRRYMSDHADAPDTDGAHSSTS